MRLQTTTLWYAPSQQHGADPDTHYGDPRYEGRTPSYVIWNVLERYTRRGDLVVDPFVGGGTTIDVAREMEREVRGFDLRPWRDDVEFGDARRLPVEDESVDFVFMDPPYSTHIEYSDDPRCIGKLDAFEEGYFEAMDEVLADAERVLRDRRYLAIYVQDTFKKKRGFVPIGLRLGAQLSQRFRLVDHIAVVRGNRKLEKPSFHKAAVEGNFFMRGFNHLLIAKKER